MKYDDIINTIEHWVLKNELDYKVIAENFYYESPLIKAIGKKDFIEKIQRISSYHQKNIFSNIVKFDPVIKLKSPDQKHFAIILQYYTKNGTGIYEAVFGTVANNMLVELRLIYDLHATKKAFGLE